MRRIEGAFFGFWLRSDFSGIGNRRRCLCRMEKNTPPPGASKSSLPSHISPPEPPSNNRMPRRKAFKKSSLTPLRGCRVADHERRRRVYMNRRAGRFVAAGESVWHAVFCRYSGTVGYCRPMENNAPSPGATNEGAGNHPAQLEISSAPRMPRRKAFKKFVAYTAPAVIALLTARDADAY
jgi:hypothetical protein